MFRERSFPTVRVPWLYAHFQTCNSGLSGIHDKLQFSNVVRTGEKLKNNWDLSEIRFLDFNSLRFPVINFQILLEYLRESEHGTAFHLVNAGTIASASQDPKLLRILQEEFLICDGKPLSALLRLQEKSFSNFRGPDLMRRITTHGQYHGGHFFLGSTDENLSMLIQNIRESNPNLHVSGSHAPEFSAFSEELVDKWVDLIEVSGAKIVWVGLGTPKQDFVVSQIAKKLPVKVFAVGAAFDFIAGNKREAPIIVRKLYLEWLYRFLLEPKRLLARYTIGNLIFFSWTMKYLKNLKR